jgi:hypothetical protein
MRRGTKRVSDTQISLGTEYQSRSERRGDRSRTPVLTGTPSGSVPALASGTKHPSGGCVPLSSSAEAPRPVRVLVEGERRFEGCDVKALPAMLWGLLPRCATLHCLPDSSALPAFITNSLAVWRALRRTGRAVFDQHELKWLVSASVNDRASPFDLVQWCAHKRAQPTWRLNERDALGALPRSHIIEAGDVTIGHVLAAWGLELGSISYDHEVPR